MDLAAAVRNRQVISFVYDGLHRVVQPATYGETTTGKLTLRACQIDGLSKSTTLPFWKLYTEEKLVDPVVTGDVFSTFAEDGYTRGDSAFARIIAEH